MGVTKADIRWIKRGRQKAAVARALERPMTPTEILGAARLFNPRIQLRDVWFLIGQLKKRRLVRCLTPCQLTGKVYDWTPLGKSIVQSAFGTQATQTPRGVEWDFYAEVIRAKTRQYVLLELNKIRFADGDAKTASQIRRNLKEQHPMGLNSVLRALKDLGSRQLVQCVGVTETRKQKLYGLTQAGQRIAAQLENSERFGGKPY